MNRKYDLKDYYDVYKDSMLFNDDRLDIPERTKRSLDRWACFAEYQGGFITAVLENNLVEAFNKADRKNLNALDDIVKYIYNHLPFECWGSIEKVEKWEGLELRNKKFIDLRKKEDITILNHGDTIYVNIKPHSRGYVKYMFDKIFDVRKQILNYYEVKQFIVTAGTK